MIICATCKEIKLITDFAKRNNRKKGIQSSCKSCDKEKRKHSPKYSKYRSKEYIRESNLYKNYGITLADFNIMLAQQNGVCKVCGGPSLGKGTYHVDHCHSTGKIRGLLCHKCNVALGMVQDSKNHLRKLISYLELT